jgi:hypothetical protein
MKGELDCAVHVEAPDTAALEELLAALPAPGVELYVDENDEADERRSDFPDGFLHFSHVVEVYADGGPAIAYVTRLLEALWARGWAAVAASDYEQELPRAGGYKARDVPWPGR